jgi:hypothetical protein
LLNYKILRRVEDEMRGKFLKSVRESKPVTERKRKYRENKKERERAKKQSKIEDRTDDWGKLRDDVKFGEVADAPPILKAIPKARGAAKKVSIISLRTAFSFL